MRYFKVIGVTGLVSLGCGAVGLVRALYSFRCLCPFGITTPDWSAAAVWVAAVTLGLAAAPLPWPSQRATRIVSTTHPRKLTLPTRSQRVRSGILVALGVLMTWYVAWRLFSTASLATTLGLAWSLGFWGGLLLERSRRLRSHEIRNHVAYVTYGVLSISESVLHSRVLAVELDSGSLTGAKQEASKDEAET